MKFNDILLLVEARTAPLYHATSMLQAEKILAGNSLTGYTLQTINGKTVHGVSLSRDLNFAKHWLTTGNAQSGKGRGGVIFELDQNKLAQRYKIAPIDYYHSPDSIVKTVELRTGDYAEAEEFVVTSEIRNLENYIIHILMLSKTFKMFNNAIEKMADLNMVEYAGAEWDPEELTAIFNVILTHPKLKVV